MPDFQFVGGTYVAQSLTQDDQECINYYPEVDPTKFGGSPGTNVTGERGVIALYPCPGLVQLTSLPTAAAVRGMRTLPGGATLLVVSGQYLYSVNAAYIATQVGTLLTQTGPVSITDNGTSAYLCDGPNRYYYTWGTSTFAVVSDGAFTGANTVDVVDNYIVYNNPMSNQWGSTNVGSVVSSGLNVASTLSAPGNVVGLIADHRNVWLMGENFSEVWVDAGLFPFAFQILAGTNTQYGLAARGSIARLGGSFAFLAVDRRGKPTVMMMNGYTPQPISTPAVEWAIGNYSIISDAIGMSYRQAGHEFYMLTFPTADATWCYDVSTGLWHKRAWLDKANQLHRHRANCMEYFQGQVICGDWQNGAIYALSLSTYTDAGVTMLGLRRARHITDDLKRQYFHSLQIQFQPGTGLVTGQGQTPKAMLRWSDDGGFTWSNEHWTNIGQLGQYKNRTIWRQLGQSRDRIFEVQVSDPVARPIISAELKASAGAH